MNPMYFEHHDINQSAHVQHDYLQISFGNWFFFHSELEILYFPVNQESERAKLKLVNQEY